MVVSKHCKSEAINPQCGRRLLQASSSVPCGTGAAHTHPCTDPGSGPAKGVAGVRVKHSFVLGRSDFHYRHELLLYGWRRADTGGRLGAVTTPCGTSPDWISSARCACRRRWRSSGRTGSRSPTSASARGRRWCSCTAPPRTAACGGRSSLLWPTSSRSSPGTSRGRLAPRMCPRISAWRTTRTASRR